MNVSEPLREVVQGVAEILGIHGGEKLFVGLPMIRLSRWGR